MSSRVTVIITVVLFGVLAVGLAYVALFANFFLIVVRGDTASSSLAATAGSVPTPALDTKAYNDKLLALAHINPLATSTVGTTTILTYAGRIATTTASSSVWVLGKKWPVSTVYPHAGAILPFNRIVAYYGNFYSTQMGVLGEYSPSVVLTKLMDAVAQWQAADPSTPVIPAIDYIAVTAQASAGKDGMYRARMPDSQIDQALSMAKEVNGLVFLDVQVGKSTLSQELPVLKKYLSMPQVELAIDPEFSMKDGAPPGIEIGTYDASDINYAANYLAQLVREYHLPPKILVIHRFTLDMVTNYKKIKPLPEVEIVMDMDGWGSQAKKIGTYTNVVAAQPVQFTVFKLFYKNDLRPPSTGLLTPRQILNLTPAPSFIQYQ